MVDLGRTWAVYVMFVAVGCAADSSALSPSSPPSPDTEIAGTIETELTPLTGAPSKIRPRDLSTESLVIYTMDGTRFPAEGSFHGTTAGEFHTGDTFPPGRFVLRIGDQRYEVLDDHTVHIIDRVIGDPDLVTVTTPSPIDIDIALASSWQQGDGLVAIVPRLASSHPSLELELDPPPAAGSRTLTSTFDWSSLPNAAVHPDDTLVLRHVRTTIVTAPSLTAITHAIGELTTTVGAAAGTMDVLAPQTSVELDIDRDGLARSFPDHRMTPDVARWGFDLEEEPFAPFVFDQVVVAAPGPVIAPQFAPTMSVHARYIQPENLHVSSGLFPVFDELRETLPLAGASTYTLTPGPTIQSVTVDDANPDGLAIIIARGFLEVHADIADTGASAPDLSVMWRDLRAPVPGFAVHGTGSEVYVPAEALAAGEYVIRVDVTAGRKATSKWYGPVTVH